MAFGTLYTHNPTPRAFAILAISKAYGLELDLVDAEKENRENYARLLEYNPLGQVPVFVGADGMVLTECIAIAMYIAAQDRNTKLLGCSEHLDKDQLQILRWMSFANSELLPNIGRVILPLMGRSLPIRKNSQDCLRQFHADCRYLEQHLASDPTPNPNSKSNSSPLSESAVNGDGGNGEKRGGKARKYLVGEQLTLADLFTVGTMIFAVKVFHEVLEREYSGLMRWFRRVYEEPMFKDVVGELELLNVPYPKVADCEE